LVFSAEVPGCRRQVLGALGLALVALWTCLARPSFRAWKLTLKGFWRLQVRDWEDALVQAWVVGVESNPGVVEGSQIRFLGTSVPLVSRWAETVPLVGDRVVLVAHYSVDGRVSATDERSWALLRQAGYRVVVVSTSLTVEAAEALDVDAWLVRPNVGHDFLSWRAALEVWSGPLSLVRYLALTNNSAVVQSTTFLSTFEGWQVPVASVTGSLQIFPHAESYFWWFDMGQLTWQRLTRFFSGVPALAEKRQLIHRGEIGFSRYLAEEGLKFRALYPYDSVVAALVARRDRYPREFDEWRAHDPINPSKKLLAVLRDEGAPVLKKVGPWVTLPTL
jgi:hypothetical protein